MTHVQAHDHGLETHQSCNVTSQVQRPFTIHANIASDLRERVHACQRVEGRGQRLYGVRGFCMSALCATPEVVNMTPMAERFGQHQLLWHQRITFSHVQRNIHHQCHTPVTGA
eukprot:2340673-Karenia_brevis.AAC.1